MTIGDVILSYRKKHGISQREFSKLCGLSNGSISILEKGINPKTKENIVPTLSTLNNLAKGMGITINTLIEMVDDLPISLVDEIVPYSSNNIENASKYDNILAVKKVKLPILGEIACGQPIYAEEQHEIYIDVENNYGANFCLKAKGESMLNAGISDGDIVLIKEMKIVNNGEIAAVIIGDDATLKRVYYYPDKGKLILTPENPNYEPLVYIGEEINDISILGKAVAVIKKL